jgi:signal transduction histidine kinase
LFNQIAHTLRNPIFAAMVQAEALMVRAAKVEGIANSAQLVHRQLKRLEDAINEMLLYGRPPKLSQRQFELVGLVDQVAHRFHHGEMGEPANIEVVRTENHLVVELDPDAVKVILERLLRNAVQHTESPHTIQLEVAAAESGMFQVTIRDHGEGIPEEIQEKMFLPFYPQHSGRPGLGLAVAAKFAQALGGRIEIDSAEGEGTVARCVLPIRTTE